jgi:ethanolamine utilization microcompartment shell protein EutS
MEPTCRSKVTRLITFKAFAVHLGYLEAFSVELVLKFSHCSDVGVFNKVNRVVLNEIVNSHSEVFTEQIVGKFYLFLVCIVIPLYF